MIRNRLFWNLFPAFLLFTVVPLTLFTLYVNHSIREFYLDQLKENLKARAALVADASRTVLKSRDGKEIDRLCKLYGDASATRFTVITSSGEVLGDTERNPAAMDDHGKRQEVLAALRGRVGASQRFSHTLQQNMLYVAVPVTRKGEASPGLVVRAAVPITRVERKISSVPRDFFIAGLILVFLTLIISYTLARSISTPIREIQQGARRYAEGHLDRSLPLRGPEEIRDLAKIMNNMASRLHATIQTIMEQKNRQEAIFHCILEGILAVDTEERVIDLNEAAALILNVEGEEAKGRLIQETLRNVELQTMISEILAQGVSREREILFLDEEERHIRARGTVLTDENEKAIGCVVALQDITRVRRLENVRKNFVSNVSHELKTPITAIQGVIETLKGEEFAGSKEARSFLTMLNKHSNRLHAIVEDLLLLARVEQQEENGGLQTETIDVKEFLEAAVLIVNESAARKKIRIELTVEEKPVFTANQTLAEQAVVNLLDNAVKYSPPESVIRVVARGDDEALEIRVTDRGAGMEPEHLPHIFERFYQVDKSHSRRLGGTGLGLAIVRHIMAIHEGEVTAESVAGEGSTFTLIFPERGM